MIIHDRMIGNTLTPLGAQLKQRNASGVYVPVVLTGLTVKFKMVAEDGTVTVAETSTGVTIADATNGKVEYDFLAADVDTAGTYWGWFYVYSGTEYDSFPSDGRTFKIVIHEAA